MTFRADEPGERVCERALVWHVGGLRLFDQAAVAAAAHEARTVYPLVVRDDQDPAAKLKGYPAAVQALARDYRELGAYLCYLEGEAERLVVDAARDARADYVYVLARQDRAGAELLARVQGELELWGFKSRVFSGELYTARGELRALKPRPASLSGQPLPGQDLPASAPWGEREALAWLKGAKAARQDPSEPDLNEPDLNEIISLGLVSERLLQDLLPLPEAVGRERPASQGRKGAM